MSKCESSEREIAHVREMHNQLHEEATQFRNKMKKVRRKRAIFSLIFCSF